jgi:hypothetical protein
MCEWGQFSCRCQKQPWTKMTLRFFVKTMSGRHLPGIAAECNLYRYPIEWSSLRIASSGFVSRPLIARIICDRISVLTVSVTLQFDAFVGFAARWAPLESCTQPDGDVQQVPSPKGCETAKQARPNTQSIATQTASLDPVKSTSNGVSISGIPRRMLCLLGIAQHDVRHPGE